MTNKIAKRSLRILVAGGGVAGQALAFWLARGGHAVTVVERSPALRASGAQVDLRGQGIEAVERMGLLLEVRKRLVDEAGVAFVDSRGKPKATIMANTSGKGRQTLTSEYEIMRGDLVRILHEATKDDAEYVFGKSVDGFDQHASRVTAHFSDGTSGEYDLLIGADGQGSRTRRTLLPRGVVPCGMGISGGLVGAYVLAGEINRNPADLPAALANYEQVLRPFVDEIQGEVNPRILRMGMPLSKHSISAFQSVTALACFLHIPDLVARMSTQDRGGDWQLPAFSDALAA
ncbi:FAD-dependent monooxygenase [Streptomyces olivaceus]|uniref:FAD-dependent monooxygenase n=1 Tax=Streptomyces olivaceus TaxID=47716 RepID=UPI001CCA5E21|nr:FAD-dependent monooxygenase [Streptomyces olivaceus]MBZ6142267.1 FAD-dependent monooxygenase [Streptomyces olivaceus]MBZ6170038.1 FAD-dependent monooxygenase [Streptomyces olivaceus]